MSKAKQNGTHSTQTTIHPSGDSPLGGRTRAAARNGISTARQQLAVLDAICKDHADEADVMDPNVIFKAITKVQGVVGLGIRGAAEARRNPQFKSDFLSLSA
jgi:hypothetical protein